MPLIQDIPRPQGSALRTVRQQRDDTPQQLAEALALRDVGPVVVLADGQQRADAALVPRLTQLLGRGMLRAVREAGALAVVGASPDALLDAVLDDYGQGLRLLGVASQDAVTPPSGDAADAAAGLPAVPRLSHLLLTAAPASAGLLAKIDTAAAIAGTRPGLLVAAGNGEHLTLEVRAAVRHGWTVLLVPGSGSAVDALARQVAARSADGDDPVVAEIIADGHIISIPLAGQAAQAVESMARQVLRGVGGESVLHQAWRRFAAIDAAANQQQRDFSRSQLAILTLGLIAVALSIVYAGPFDGWMADWGLSPEAAARLKSRLNFVLVLVPIVVSVLIAGTNRFKPGKRWVLLRSAAESIKREMYRYRLGAADYVVDAEREKNLAQAVEDITRRLARTEANTTALPAFTGAIPPANAVGAGDDGLSRLSTDQYTGQRLANQLAFYRRKTVKLEKQLWGLQVAVLAAGAAGTLLAAVGGSAVIWISLSTALASAVMTYLSYRQVESTLTSYNQTATDLENILAWWTSLAPDEQSQRDNIEALATHTEKVLADELAGWTQSMTDALEKLRDAQTPKKDEKDAKDAKDAKDGSDNEGNGGNDGKGAKDGEGDAGGGGTGAAAPPAEPPPKP